MRRWRSRARSSRSGWPPACSWSTDCSRFYRWEGRIDESAECQLVAKTTPAAATALVERLRALHPYDVPEIVTLDATASAAYGAWLLAETGTPGD